MNERQKFIHDYLRREETVTSLATSYGVSRKTANKWIARFKESGFPGLADRERGAGSHPNATPDPIVSEVLELRRRRRYWGPKKLLWKLELNHPEINWPAKSTVGAILKRNGMVGPMTRRRRSPVAESGLVEPKAPNHVWATDFKGWFRTEDGKRVDPLTVSDLASRFLSACEALLRPTFEESFPVFERTFQEHGLPDVMRSDNGVPFASVSVGGLTRLSKWWVRLGIKPERISRGKPQQNGCHERMHRTLKQETATPPKANAHRQQQAFGEFRDYFNHERPHEALGMRCPAEIYRPSLRPYPSRLPELEYSDDYKLRSVRSNGYIKWGGSQMFVSDVLAGEVIGLLPLADGIWAIDFGSYRLGYLNDRKGRIMSTYSTKEVSPTCPV